MPPLLVVHFGKCFNMSAILTQNSALVKEKCKKMSIGLRIKEERMRLELNQEEFADLINASRRSFVAWEQDVASPNGKYLAAMSECGVDVQYVLTGVRSINWPDPHHKKELTSKEAILLNAVSQCRKEDRDAIFRIANIAAGFTRY